MGRPKERPGRFTSPLLAPKGAGFLLCCATRLPEVSSSHYLIRRMFGLILIITFLFTLVFAFLIKSVDIDAVKGDWAARRCAAPILFTGWLYKPADDPRSGKEFMQENFNFCVSKLMDSALASAFAPFLGVAGGSGAALGTMNGALGNIKGMLKNATDAFSSIVGITHKRFADTIGNFVGVWHRLQFMFQRAVAAALSTVYAGMSFLTGFLNLYDFVVKVVIIILSILVALIFFLFFALIPVMPVIFTVLSVLIGAGLGSAVGGMASVFCVDPEAGVRMADGTVKALKEVKVGDVLAGRREDVSGSDISGQGLNVVEGVLICSGEEEACVSIHGVKMSGSHRVLYGGGYILAQDHPEAVPAESLPRLICLNTTQHDVPIVSTDGTLWVSDWEEVDDDAGRRAWLAMVNDILNPGLSPQLCMKKEPTTVPLLSPSTLVRERTRGIIPLRELKIGDYVLDAEKHYTRVLATYTGEFHADNRESFWISDGVWAYTMDGIWTPSIYGSIKESASLSAAPLKGLNIITESGSFYIKHNGIHTLVRDFTEMGKEAVAESYQYLDEYIHGM